MLFDSMPYLLQSTLVSRSVSFENPTGQPGQAGRAASPLGVGRKGSAVRHVEANETVTLADIEGRGIIRHIWLTTHDKPRILRGSLIRVFWDEQDYPSIEIPLGDFFGFALGRARAFQSVFHSVSSTKGMNCWLPMPFLDRARVELVNRSGTRFPLFYQIDYTLGDQFDPGVGHLHACFRRDNPTRQGQDFEILPERYGPLRYLGCILGVRPTNPLWWGEGEMKAYIDGDDRAAFPTICGTGSEDYVGHAFGIQDEDFLYHGCNYRENDNPMDTGRVSIYRWHLADPIVCQDRMRVTIQQIGHRPTYAAKTVDDYKAELYERSDDWSAATFWYQPLPSAPTPPCPDGASCLADIDGI